MVPNADMSNRRQKQYVECIGPKQAQLITMHSQDISKNKVVYQFNKRDDHTDRQTYIQTIMYTYLDRQNNITTSVCMPVFSKSPENY